MPFVLDCRAVRIRFRQQNFTAGFREPDSSNPIPAKFPSIFHSLFFSHPPFLSPVLDFFDRGILCHELSMFHDSGMVMGVGEADGQLQGGRQKSERRAAPLELCRASPLRPCHAVQGRDRGNTYRPTDISSSPGATGAGGACRTERILSTERVLLCGHAT